MRGGQHRTTTPGTGGGGPSDARRSRDPVAALPSDARRSRWWVVMTALLGVPLAAAELAVESATVAVGQVVQWRIDGAKRDWLWTDPARTPALTITDPAGAVVRRRAFLDADAERVAGDPGSGFRVTGAPVLRLRHTPRRPGIHTWSLADRQGQRIAGGTVAVAAGNALGAIRVSARNARFLVGGDGRPFIPIGPNIAWAVGPDRPDQLAGYLARAGANGGTHARLWLASWSGQTEGVPPAALRFDHAHLIDHALAAARRAGLLITLVLDNHHDRENGGTGAYGATAEERRAAIVRVPPHRDWAAMVRYHLARWGADDTIAAWEPMNEPDLLEPVREKVLPWSMAAAALIRSEDPDRRLVTLGWCGDDAFRTAGEAGVDLVQPHAYIHAFAAVDDTLRREADDAVGWLIRRARPLDAAGRPWWFGEIGFQLAKDGSIPGEDLDRRGFAVLQLAWTGWLLGGAGPASHWWWDRHIDRMGLWHLWRGQAAAAARIDWDDATLAPLTPGDGPVRVLGWVGRTQALVWFTHQADTWRRTIIDGEARVHPDPATVAALGGFAPGDYAVTRLHWAAGGVRAEETLTVDDTGVLRLTAGSATDTVAVIRRR